MPSSFGLTREQRILCYSLFEIYEKWRTKHKFWDEMDRTLYCLKHGPPPLSEFRYVSWQDRYDTTFEDFPYFFDVVCADEGQDFTESDMALLVRLSGGVRSLFLCADAAQSVEQVGRAFVLLLFSATSLTCFHDLNHSDLKGIVLRNSTINDVFYSMITGGTRVKGTRVNDVVDIISLKTNHRLVMQSRGQDFSGRYLTRTSFRTHAAILDLAAVIRKILARSFQVANPKEEALINGDLPEMLSIKSLDELAPGKRFRGANVVFVAPDELVETLRSRFNLLGLSNDV